MALVDDCDGLWLLRSSPDAAPGPGEVAALARTLAAEEPTPDLATVVVGAEHGRVAPEVWTSLGDLLDILYSEGMETLRLVLSGAGTRHRDRPAIAQQIADAWEIEVIAPEASVLIVPGGSLFVHGRPAGDGGGWQRFRPGAAKPEPLGPRSPAPAWQSAVGRLPGEAVRDCTVEQIPAGVLVRPRRAREPQPGDPCYAVPVDAGRLTVVVGAPGADVAAEVPSGDLAALLATLPAAVRSAIRLAPGGDHDLLLLGQDIADRLGMELEVCTGLPLLDKDAGTGGGSGGALAGGGAPAVRPALIGPDGEPTWRPFVESVACLPSGGPGSRSAANPRLLRWRSPVAVSGGDAESGFGRTLDSGSIPAEPGTFPFPFPFSDHWQVAVTRAGLVVGPRGAAPPIADRRVRSDRVSIDVGLPGQPLDAALLPELSLLLLELDVRGHGTPTLHARGHFPDGGRELRRLSVRHGVPLLEDLPEEGPAVERPAPEEPATAVGQDAPSAQSPAVTSDVDQPGSVTTTGTAEDRTAVAVAAVAVAEPAAETVAEPARPAASAPTPAAADGASPHSSAPGLLDARDPHPPQGVQEPAEKAHPREGREAAEREGPPIGSRAAMRIPMTPVSSPAPAAANSAATAPRSPAETPDVEPGRAEPPVSPGESTAGPEREPARTEPAPVDEAAEPIRAAPADRPAATPPPVFAADVTAAPPTPAAAPPPHVPFTPAHRSTESERAAFRAYAQEVWERHAAAVQRSLTRMPTLRGEEGESVRVDLIAVYTYLRASEGPLHHEELVRGLRQGDRDVEPYAACLASGLRRLPSYRGVAVRGGVPATAGLDGPGPGGAGGLVPGAVLHEPAPLSALPMASADAPAGPGRYVIWSSTGRRVRSLLGAASARVPDEVVFSPGTAFRVLDVRPDGSEDFDGSQLTGPLVVLSELPGATAGAGADRPAGLDDTDRATLARIGEAVVRHESTQTNHGAGPAVDWPERCTGLLGPLGGGAP